MTETEESIRDRALAAWRERKQEMAVEAERRETESKLCVLRSATAWAVTVLDDGNDIRSAQEVDGAAAILGIEATEPRRLCDQMWTVDLTVGHMTFRWTSSDVSIGTTRSFELIGECPDCGAEVPFGFRIANLTQLGTALDEQEHNPKALHCCPAPVDLDDNGEPMKHVDYRDPADVLLDAIQTYIHAAVNAAVENLTSEEPF
jgi:hypothetical protein